MTIFNAIAARAGSTRAIAASLAIASQGAARPDLLKTGADYGKYLIADLLPLAESGSSEYKPDDRGGP
jgi:hypothetical protein